MFWSAYVDRRESVGTVQSPNRVLETYRELRVENDTGARYYDCSDIHYVRGTAADGSYYVGVTNDRFRATELLYANVTLRLAETPCLLDCKKAYVQRFFSHSVFVVVEEWGETSVWARVRWVVESHEVDPCSSARSNSPVVSKSDA